MEFAESLTATEWVLIIGALTAAVVQILTLLGYKGAAKKVKAGAAKGVAMIHAIEEIADKHPELAGKIRRIAKVEALKLGVQLGPDGLHQDVIRERQARALKNREPNA